MDQSSDLLNEAPRPAPTTCAACSCLCDDILVTVGKSGPDLVENACPVGLEWFQSSQSTSMPLAAMQGESVNSRSAARAAAALLADAKLPLVYGLRWATSQSVRSALAVADRFQAIIDTPVSSDLAGSLAAMRRVGTVTSTLGEVRDRADLVIYWGADPHTTHPRHPERFTSGAPLRLADDENHKRRVVVIDDAESASVAAADEFIRIPREASIAALWTLRALVRGRSGRSAPSGIPLESLDRLAGMIRDCQFGAIFHGGRLAAASARAVEQLSKLVMELNETACFVLLPMGAKGNLVGVEHAFCWQTGYSSAVSFTRKYPRHVGKEWGAQGLLERGLVDAALLIGADAVDDLSDAARDHLRGIPIVTIDHQRSSWSERASIAFTTSIAGRHSDGIYSRADGIPLPLRPTMLSSYPSVDFTLGMLGHAAATSDGAIPRSAP
ncbi:hypothetical protein Pan216_54520 [Planctomycetes bacterium Pan216]|uniref:Formyltransferase/hydrolase complex Fhc subunit B n=1 Tax=Kolteria novifilia TaxID=2527975 RepID=A0A518BC53_9BACT|nr:hypothetical protein Pan216_54520 [Planctomycetes bacterium Pan216]